MSRALDDAIAIMPYVVNRRLRERRWPKPPTPRKPTPAESELDAEFVRRHLEIYAARVT